MDSDKASNELAVAVNTNASLWHMVYLACKFLIHIMVCVEKLDRKINKDSGRAIRLRRIPSNNPMK